MEQQEQQFIKGFNHGYLLAIHEPDLIKKIVSNKNDHNEYFKGLVFGKQEHDIEKIKKRMHGVSSKSQSTKEITKSKGRGK